MAAAPRQNHGTFDDAKLAAMNEPLTVRIDRLKNNQRSPIPVWPSDSNHENGEGFTKEEIRRLEGYLVTQWSGGGLYEISVVDSSEQPQKMTWRPFYPTNTYPETIPPPLQDAVNPETTTIFSAPNPQPQGSRMPPMFPQPPFAPTAPGGYPMPPPPQVGSQQYTLWQAEADRRERELELKKLRDENERRERETLETRHKAELERERLANNDRFQRLEAMMTSLATSLKEAATPKGPSPELLAMQAQFNELKEHNRRLETNTDNQRREQEAERRETLIREQMRVQAEEAKRAYEATQRQIETMQREFQTMITNMMTQMQNASSKADPFITLMTENQRQHAEVLKEMARENSAAMARVQAFMMNPREMVALARESQQGVEQAVERTTRMTSTVLDMQQRVLETALNTQPQGGGVIDAVTKGMDNVKEFLERFVGAKQKEAVAQAQAQATIAQAQAHVMEVQARAANPAAFPQPPALAGPPVMEPTEPTKATPQPPTKPTRLWGRTDEEWFGPALDDVLDLRKGVAEFVHAAEEMLSSGKIVEKTTDVPGIHPDRAAEVIVIAATMAQQRQIPIPAMIELLGQGLLAEFVSVLVPDAPQKYRDGVVEILKRGPQEENEDDDDDNGDEEEETPPPPSAKPSTKPAKNGRARA